jgi:hypothetical protein
VEESWPDVRYSRDALEGLKKIKGNLGSAYQVCVVDISTRDFLNTKQEYCHLSYDVSVLQLK